MKLIPEIIHPEFRLNGLSCDGDALMEVGYSYIKEGEEYELPIGDFLLDWLSDSPTVSVRTSGSTGIPKIIELTKKAMIESAGRTAEFLGLPNGSSALHCLPATHIAGKMMLVRAMVLGWSVDLVSPSSSPLLEARGAYDFCAMVPLQLKNSIPHLNRIQKLIVGGAPLSREIAKKAANTSTSIYETYGMTETASHIALRPVSNSEETDSGIQMEPFTALAGIELSQDDRGCLTIELPWQPGKIVTNDMVELIKPDQFQWLGRVDNVINSGGIKLFPETVEQKLSDITDHRIIAIGLPDETLGQKLVLVIEGDIDEIGLSAAIGKHPELDPYEIPRDILKLEKFPETANRKIDRPAVLKWAEGN